MKTTKLIKKALYISPFFVFFIWAVYLENKSPITWVFMSKNIEYFIDRSKIYLLGLNHSLSNCSLENISLKEIKSLKEKPVLIVGHAYGSAMLNPSNGLSQSLLEYLEANREYFDSVILTGDVFHTPSIEKWRSLDYIFKDTPFLIAPGNHDVGFGDNTMRDVFYDWSKSQLPIIKEEGTNLLLIEDSTIKPWHVRDESLTKLSNLKKGPQKKNLFIFVHHVLHPGMHHLANSMDGWSDEVWLNELKAINHLFNSITVISGDSGGFPHFPRSMAQCDQETGVNYIVSGLGNVESDVVLVLSNNKIFHTKINF